MLHIHYGTGDFRSENSGPTGLAWAASPDDLAEAAGRGQKTGEGGASALCRSPTAVDGRKHIWPSAQSLIDRHWAYARYTRHSHYAVRTTHNLCDRLLRKDPSEAQLAEIHNWTLQALQVDNDNPYIWDLWAKVLAVAGADEPSLDIRWEAVRRFPDNLVVRMAMIVALAGNDRLELAENLFDGTTRDFPNEAIKPRLLQAHRWDEATSEMSAHSPDDPIVDQVLRVVADEQFFNGSHDRNPTELEMAANTLRS